MWNATFRLLTASLLQAMGSTGCGTALYIMVVCCEWCISIRRLFPCIMASPGVGWFFVRRWFRCFLIIGIHASGISAPLSLLMLFGSSLMWIASFSFIVYQCLSRSISLVSFHSGLCPVPLTCSETAEFWVRASHISLYVVFFHSFLHRSSCFPDVDFAACASYLVDYAILLAWISGVFLSDQPRS